MSLRPAGKLAVAILSLGVVVGAHAQSTQPAPPASGSTGMDKGAGSSTKSGSAASSLSGSDRRFIEKAAQGGMAEVEMGKVAMERASSPQVKDFAKRMVDDHSKANSELKSVASAKGVTLPTSMDNSHKRKMDAMMKRSGADFDRAYIEEMVDDHNRDVKDFRATAKNAKDPDVKNFAAKTLPTLEQHQATVKSLQDTLRSAGRNASSTTAANRTGGTASGGTASSGAAPKQ